MDSNWSSQSKAPDFCLMKQVVILTPSTVKKKDVIPNTALADIFQKREASLRMKVIHKKQSWENKANSRGITYQ